MKTWQSSEAGTHFPTLLNAARGGEWQLVATPGGPAALAAAGELAELLAHGYRFHPEVAIDAEGVGIWLPELRSRGAGASLDEAMQELAADMLRCAQEWQERLRETAEHRLQAGYVRRIQLAGERVGVLELLADDAYAASAEAGSARETAPADTAAATAPGAAAPARHWMGPSDRIAQMRAALEEREG